jgi:hypothetical protein
MGTAPCQTELSIVFTVCARSPDDHEQRFARWLRNEFSMKYNPNYDIDSRKSALRQGERFGEQSNVMTEKMQASSSDFIKLHRVLSKR